MPQGILGPNHREAYHDDFFYSNGREKELRIRIPASGWLMAVTVTRLGNGPDMLCTLIAPDDTDIDTFVVEHMMSGGGIWKPLINVNSSHPYRLRIEVHPIWVKDEPDKDHRLPKLVIGHTSCWQAAT